MRIRIPTLVFAACLLAPSAQAQTVDRDMTLIEPTTSAGGTPIKNLKDCLVDVVDSSGTTDSRTLPASAPTGGGTQTIDLTAKIGFTTGTARCELAGLMSRALANGIGLAIKTEDRDALMRRFYTERKRQGLPELENLTFHKSPLEEHELWIVVNPQEKPNGKP